MVAHHNRQTDGGVNNAMSIVLPKRANVDFLAPSQALQDAKKKLGPVYFDAKLIECPQNAVELSKLIQEWDEIDKKKFKIIEETRRNQRVLLHTLGSKYTFSKHVTGLDSASDLRDAKLPPPGFRYHSNGAPKLSLVQDQDIFSEYSPSQSWLELKSEGDEEPFGLPLGAPRRHLYKKDIEDASKTAIENISGNVSLSSTNSDFQPAITDKYIPGESRITIAKIEKEEPSINIDYENEIKNLENIIKEINEDLEKNNIDLHENSGSAKGKVYAFLRAHARGDKVSLKQLVEPQEWSRPNDRFAIPPGSSTFDVRDPLRKSKSSKSDLHKRKINTRNHGNCVACVCKIKDHNAALSQKRKDVSKLVLKRWNSSTRGNLNESSTFLSTAFLNKRACSAVALRRNHNSSPRADNASPIRSSKTTVPHKDEEGKYPLTRHTKKSSQVMFRTESLSSNNDSLLRTAKSTPETSVRKQVSSREHLRNTKSAMSERKIDVLERRAQSALFARPSSCLRDRQSRMEFLKEDARLEEQECTRKVEAFIKKMKKMTAPPKPSIAFL
ncbi:uncharacterized protein LOC132563975 [Ylistrum balloti]|uniref:uncharacterized protein LOC132563975 n=1 Tax=Ylistrum balloti TaxID=509963 RepID=UPI00290593BE|nr:uncharacterized protein LOC132563975 [Ylistrum balloti]